MPLVYANLPLTLRSKFGFSIPNAMILGRGSKTCEVAIADIDNSFVGLNVYRRFLKQDRCDFAETDDLQMAKGVANPVNGSGLFGE